MDKKKAENAGRELCTEIVTSQLEKIADTFAVLLRESADGLVGTSEWSRMADEINTIFASMQAVICTVFSESLHDDLIEQARIMVTDKYVELSNKE